MLATTPPSLASSIRGFGEAPRALQAQLQEARQREAWLRSIIEQSLLPPPRQGVIERIAAAMARLSRPEGNPERFLRF